MLSRATTFSPTDPITLDTGHPHPYRPPPDTEVYGNNGKGTYANVGQLGDLYGSFDPDNRNKNSIHRGAIYDKEGKRTGWDARFRAPDADPLPPGPYPKGVVIVGAGTFGLATALNLATRGVRPIQVVEASGEVGGIPCSLARGYQLQHPLTAEYGGTKFYCDLNQASLPASIYAAKLWKKDVMLKNYLVEQGYALVNTENALAMDKTAMDHHRAAADDNPALRDAIVDLKSGEGIKELIPGLSDAHPWTGYLNTTGATVETGDALYAMYLKALGLGVTFAFKEHVHSLWWHDRKCVGAVTSTRDEPDKVYMADRVIVAAGASIPNIIPEIGGQLEATAYSLAHIQLTESEYESLQPLPVLHAHDLGYLSQPDCLHHVLQVCAYSLEFFPKPGSDRYACEPSSKYLPREAEAVIRDLLRRTLPDLADRPLINERLVWTPRTNDGHFIIDKVPGVDGLIVAVGDADRAVPLLPLLGEWVANVVLDGEQPVKKWKWKGAPLYKPRYLDSTPVRPKKKYGGHLPSGRKPARPPAPYARRRRPF